MERSTLALHDGVWAGAQRYDFTCDPAPEPSIAAGWAVEGDGLHIQADRLGIAPIFIAHQGGMFRAVSNRAQDAAAHNGAVFDHDALSVFLQVGFFVQNDTPFANVRALWPGERITVSGNGRISNDRSGPPVTPVRSGLPVEQVARHFAEMAHEAVKRRLPDPAERFCVPLSGGRDSRHILLELHRQEVRPRCAATHHAMPPQRDEDVRVAAELCAAASIPHKVSHMDPGSFFGSARLKNDLTSFHTDEHHWFRPFAEILAAEGDAIMDGLGGDTLINNVFQRAGLIKALRAGDCEAGAIALIGSRRELPFLSSAMRRELSYDRAVAHLASALRPLADTADPAKEVQFRLKVRREIALAPMTLLSPLFSRVALPLIDAEIVDFSLSLPHEEHGAPGLHDRIIAETFPDFAHIGFEKKMKSGSGFTRAESIAMSRDFRRRASALGRSRFENGIFCAKRAAISALKPDVNRDFWWMVWLLYLRDLDAVMRGMPKGAGSIQDMPRSV